MNKGKTNALDVLRTLIAERQQYDQWIATLESKRDGTPEHVFNRVYSDYRGRLDRVLGEIRSHSAELQLSITTLSARLGEVERDEETRRDSIQEAELRALVGEYAADQWEKLRTDGQRELERIAGERAALESQLNELRAIQKLSETGASTPAEEALLARAASAAQPVEPSPEPARETERVVVEERVSEPKPAPPPAPAAPVAASQPAFAAAPTQGEAEVALRSVSEPDSQAAARAISEKPSGIGPKRSTPTRPEQSKTLKCPECGTANYPTEWYCEKCGGELATV